MSCIRFELVEIAVPRTSRRGYIHTCCVSSVGKKVFAPALEDKNLRHWFIINDREDDKQRYFLFDGSTVRYVNAKYLLNSDHELWRKYKDLYQEIGADIAKQLVREDGGS